MMKTIHGIGTWTLAAALAATAAGLAGCAKTSPKPLSPASFYSNQPTPTEKSPRIEDANRDANRQATPEVKIPLGPSPTTKPSSSPATKPLAARPTVPAAEVSSSPTSGQYQIVGTIVAEVNGSPIYANKVLSLIDKPLREKAREMTFAEFKSFATGLIQQQIGELVNDEILFAAAQRALSEEDQKLADMITSQWRMQQITLAGGSVEVARSKAVTDGDDFDQLVKQQYRRNMIDIYRHRKLIPRIQVSAEDMRRYYERNVSKEFTERAGARFRLLEVSVAKTGTRQEALRKIQDKLERAQGGADFAKMCHEENDDKGFAEKSGDMGWFDKGSFAMEKVEQAVWELQPGQLTGVIDNGTAFYIAKLEEVRKGGVKDFNLQEVQDRIKDTLQKEQFRALSREVDAKLRGDAIVRTNEAMLQATLDMAMQKYGPLTVRTASGPRG